MGCFLLGNTSSTCVCVYTHRELIYGKPRRLPSAKLETNPPAPKRRWNKQPPDLSC
ncbi:hypothetical protein BDP81DRAFT_442683 [Colletotrichum phormii]|uniref:Uncharacterized protein n=1 Tax=Colletotrichum phormii TaxID=359342 RepID=A0AAJ0E9M4_9PEZI|nr:uncharacterized protein BDP81DRAFT_442683 [Colletotrichum phormii]KAK1621873.1 hypothetical protein BDP81DRAFT_442683 [Colletotrichum phormii]